MFAESRNTTRIGVGIFFLVLLFSTSVWADKKLIAESTDKRFANYEDGTTLDRKNGLLWMTRDYWQMEAKWVN